MFQLVKIQLTKNILVIVTYLIFNLVLVRLEGQIRGNKFEETEMSNFQNFFLHNNIIMD